MSASKAGEAAEFTAAMASQICRGWEDALLKQNIDFRLPAKAYADHPYSSLAGNCLSEPDTTPGGTGRDESRSSLTEQICYDAERENPLIYCCRKPTWGSWAIELGYGNTPADRPEFERRSGYGLYDGDINRLPGRVSVGVHLGTDARSENLPRRQSASVQRARRLSPLKTTIRHPFPAAMDLLETPVRLCSIKSRRCLRSMKPGDAYNFSCVERKETAPMYTNPWLIIVATDIVVPAGCTKPGITHGDIIHIHNSRRIFTPFFVWRCRRLRQ